MSWEEKRGKEIEILLGLICQKYSIKKEELSTKSRKKNLVMARRVFMNIMFELFDEKDKMTHGDISNIVGRDRTTFIHNRKEHLNEYDRYKGYKMEYNFLKEDFESLCHT